MQRQLRRNQTRLQMGFCPVPPAVREGAGGPRPPNLLLLALQDRSMGFKCGAYR